MDNYKIPNTEEAISLLDELGYDTTGLNNRSNFLYAKSQDKNVFNGVIYPEQYELISVAKLRDLVVLKRGDVSDANCIDKKREAWYLASDGTYYAWQYRKLCWDTESDACVEAHDIQPIEKSKPQDPALISGADALRALADGKEVEYANSSLGCIRTNWLPVHTYQWSVADIKSQASENNGGECRFRLKPQTIKVELEIPAPYKAKIGGRDDTSFVLNVGRHQYCYKNEEDYAKARDALEAVFEAALRGTNS